MVTYELLEIDLGSRTVKNIKATFTDSDEVLIIPMDETNSDYQAYLNKDTLPSELKPLAPDKPAK